jgi:hypothetical protein
MDATAVAAWNANPRRKPEHVLQTRRAPIGWGGDIDNARVLVLLANPGFNPANPEFRDEPLAIPGWPLAVLAPEAAERVPGAHKWVSQRLSALFKRVTPEAVAKHVTLVQSHPWASTAFHPGCVLPSRPVIQARVRKRVEEGALVVLSRSRAIWAPALEGLSSRVLVTRSARSPFVTPGNLGEEAFERLVAALKQ